MSLARQARGAQPVGRVGNIRPYDRFGQCMSYPFINLMDILSLERDEHREGCNIRLHIEGRLLG